MFVTLIPTVVLAVISQSLIRKGEPSDPSPLLTPSAGVKSASLVITIGV